MTESEIDTNGIVFSVFHYLWLNDPYTNVQPVINVPDTIFYRLGEPKYWYFTLKGRICRKSKVKTTSQEIQEKFTRNIPQSGIVACFIQSQSKNKLAQQHFNRQSQSDNQESQKSSFDYMNLEEFNNFVSKQDYNRHGILQRFIQPKGDHNFVIKTNWSQSICLFELIKNNFNINDTKADVYQRVCTFESLRSPCMNESLKGKILPQRLESLCHNISTHIFNVSYEKLKVNQFNSYWKLDEKNHLIFILCSDLKAFRYAVTDLTSPDSSQLISPKNSITRQKLKELKEKSQNGSSINRFQYKYGIPERINEQKLSYPFPTDLTKKVICFRCFDKFDEKSIFLISLNLIVKGWEMDHLPSKYDKITVLKEKMSLKNFPKPASSGANHTKKLENLGQDVLFMDKRGEQANIKYNNFNEILQLEHQVNAFNNEIQKQINQNHQRVKVDKNYQIPKTIRFIYPKITFEEYQQFKVNNAFMNKKLTVCGSCYITILNQQIQSKTQEDILKKTYHNVRYPKRIAEKIILQNLPEESSLQTTQSNYSGNQTTYKKPLHKNSLYFSAQTTQTNRLNRIIQKTLQQTNSLSQTRIFKLDCASFDENKPQSLDDFLKSSIQSRKVLLRPQVGAAENQKEKNTISPYMLRYINEPSNLEE